MLLVPCLGSGLVLDKAMRRNLVWLRPTLFGSALAVILTVDLSNQWEVPVVGLPRELYDRYVDAVDPKVEKAELLKLAETGNVQAQYVYALRHTSYAPVELRLPEDKDVAFRWTQQAAEKGHSRAMAVVAFYYYKGNGVAKDLAKARDWANKAVKKSQPMGFRVLGDVTKEEALANRGKDGAPVDKIKQADYEKGMKEAYAHYQRGADAGDRVSLRLLAEGHDEGVPGMPRNYELGTEFLRRSAMKRDLTAIRALAERLEEGVKAPRDLSQAYCWRLVLAQLSGLAEDAEELSRLEHTMRLPEVQSGQNAAAKILKELPSEAADALSRLHTSR
jgi:TPR repeat protein